MANFWEIAAHSVDHMFFSYFDYVISRFGFDGWNWVLIASVPDLCILFTMIFPLSITRYFVVSIRKGFQKDKIKKLCLTSRFETVNISSVELLLRHNK